MNNYISTEIIDGVPQLALNTMMPAKSFTRSKLITYMQSPGYIYRKASDSFVPWKFTATKEVYVPSYKNPVIVIYGENFDGQLLADILDVQEASAYAAVRTVIEILQKAGDRNIPVPVCGAAGIVCNDGGDVLFLPAEIVGRTLQQNDLLYAQYYCQYCNPALDPVRQRAFTAGVLLYQALCGKTPFPGKMPDEVFMDISDGNFQLPEHAVPGIKKKISDCIVRLLDQQADITGKKNKNTKMQTPVIPLESVLPQLPVCAEDCIEHVGECEKNALLQKAGEISAKQAKRIAFIRSVRRAKPLITGCCIAAVLAGLLINNIITTVKNRPTTAGMTPEQVAERFYTGISSLDQQWPDACCAKSAKTPLTDMAMNLYIMYRQTEFYAKERRLYTPGEWWNLEDIRQKHMFGITRLQIEPATANTGETAAFLVSYFLITPELPPELIPEGQEGALETNSIFPLTVSKKQDRVTVSLQKDRWLISSIEAQRNEPVYIDRETFFARRIPGTVSTDIDWSPTQQEIDAGNESLNTMYLK